MTRVPKDRNVRRTVAKCVPVVFAALSMLIVSVAGAQDDQETPGPELSPLRVGDDGRHFVNQEGQPFFWLGDTAWLLFQTATREDAELYLRTRASQGFTVIQAAMVFSPEHVAGTLRSNAYGDQAFLGGNPAIPVQTPGADPSRPREYDYWDHVDYIVDRAAAHRLTLGILPLFVGFRGDGYEYLTPDRAFSYGLFLGQRYAGRPHVFWILGGDNTPDTIAKQTVWHEVARGIAVGATGTEDYAQVLMTYHINGWPPRSSSEWFHGAPWLDFNMVQVWGRESAIYRQVAKDYALEPVKPTGLGEGSYEDGPQYPTAPIDALQIRRQAYWSYFAGGYHTYGNTNTWNFGTFAREATQDWILALESPGATHMSVLAEVFGSIAWWTLRPDPSVLTSGSGDAGNVVLRSDDGDTILVYLSSPATVAVRLDDLGGGAEGSLVGPVNRVRPLDDGTAQVTWIDPRTGFRTRTGDLPASGIASFSTPAGWSDALLWLEANALVAPAGSLTLTSPGGSASRP